MNALRLAPVALLLTCGVAHASIAWTTGQFGLRPPPPSLARGALTSANNGWAIDEWQGVYFSGQVDQVLGTFGPAHTWQNSVNAFYDGWVNSHIIHNDDTGLASAGDHSGTVTFAEPIVALIYTQDWLDMSDAALGNPATTYPFGVGNRGFTQANSGLDTVLVTDPYTVWLTMGASIDQIRVLTAGVPSPGSAALLCLSASLLTARRRRA